MFWLTPQIALKDIFLHVNLILGILVVIITLALCWGSAVSSAVATTY